MLPGMPKTSAAPREYTHWRVRITDSKSGSGGGFAELEFRATVGGADLTDSLSFTAIENTHYTTNDASKAFDNSTSTFWFAAGLNNWAGAAFDEAPAVVAQIAIKSTSSGQLGNTHLPRAFVVERGDGVSWEPVLTVTGEPDWTNGETRTYTL